jgi:tripartite-type tricarboxylate transporter receptor subunit TctC
MQRRGFVLSIAPGLIAIAGRARATADVFPSKAMHYVVPVSAGGGSDFIGRVVTQRWGQLLKATIIVDNQGGGGGVIASQFTARATPDGYTLMQGYVATHGTSPATRHLSYDPIKDFTPIGMIGGTPNVLVVNPKVPATNLASFVEYVKSNPGKVNYGSSGPGSLTHLTMELFKQQMSLSLEHVPYRGIAPAFTDVIAGTTQAMFPGLSAALPHIRAGSVRAIAVTGTRRNPQIKDVPTLDELGLKGFDAMQWYGVVGPAGIPADVVKKLNDTLNAVLKAPDMREKLSAEALDPEPMSPAEFGAFIQKDIARWTQVARDQHIQLD